ncbi:MAG TPA: hypothetical protein VE439_05490 [Anaerolineae bacterium]|jgi:hypothetical protein|nr:hypothetical protein [Anaerolineae bacterium]
MSSTPQVTKEKLAPAAVPEKGKLKATEEQMLYAKILDVGMKVGLVGIVASFLTYIIGLLPPKVPIDDIINNWSIGGKEYLHNLDLQSGWSWISMYGYGDFINLFPITFLAGLTIICYLAIVPTLLKKKDTIYAVLALLEVLILTGAASGLIAGGGH